MPFDLVIPETFLFSYAYGGETYAVAVAARSRTEALDAFRLMSNAERRARIVGCLRREERDPIAELAAWLASVFRSRRHA